MSMNFFLIIQDQQGTDHRLEYHLANNPIAKKWIKKIKHICKVPINQTYSKKNDPTLAIDTVNFAIASDIKLLNDMHGKIYDVKTEYDQVDCNLLHSFIVEHLYDYNPEVRNIFYKLHQTVHVLEKILYNFPESCTAEWTESAGPLTTIHTESPYNYYDLNMSAGNLYSQWGEFGKTPYRYWHDKDRDDIDHFLATCKPHVTFSPSFVMFPQAVDYNYNTNKEFETWFEKYQQAWVEKYNADQLSVYGLGGVLLATPTNNSFDDFSQVYSIKSIELKG